MRAPKPHTHAGQSKLGAILELMILRVIGIRRLLIHQQMTIIFIMSINLEEKLLLNRAKKYANELDGVSFYSISLLEKDDFSWHRYKLMEINNINNKVKHETYSNLITENDLCNKITMLLKEEDPVKCYFFYEGRVCISIYCIDLKNLFRSIFRLNNTYDLSLSFIFPDRVLAINDNEYEVDLYYITR